MMTPNNLHHQKNPSKQDNTSQTNTTPNKKQTPTTKPQQQEQQQQQQQQQLMCPRCDSPNTKFCYYNNYSLTQPRHFCKTCRRYWTKGGALRNVPIGGGCRKSNKKLKSSASSSSSSSSVDFGGGFKLFHGLSPAMDFNLGGFSLPRVNNPSPFSTTFGDHGGGFGLDILSAGTSGGGTLLGFNAHQLSSSSSTSSGFCAPIQEMGVGGGGSMNVHTNLASSIESLSSINQDLHWKLQQQRLATLFSGKEEQKDISSGGFLSGIPHPPPFPPPKVQKNIQPILFQNLEISSRHELGVGSSRIKESGEAATEWFFGNSYGQVGGGATANTPTNSNGNGNDSGGNWDNINGVQASWGDLHHYNNSLP